MDRNELMLVSYTQKNPYVGKIMNKVPLITVRSTLFRLDLVQ